jgi:hypothetical protein
MQPTWLIEANVQGLPSEALQAEVRRQGMTCQVVCSGFYLADLPSWPGRVGG